jgi:hypothetical protein
MTARPGFIAHRAKHFLWVLFSVMTPLVSQAECAVILPALDRLEAVVQAEMTAREALVTVRRNAQDWKNLLLRGSDAHMRQTMQTRFDSQAANYEVHLVNLRKQLKALGESSLRIDILDQEQIQLFGKYRKALATHGVSSLEAAFQADREVQGADVKTLRTLEETIEVLATNNREQFQAVRQLLKACSMSAASAPQK